jgi:pilus assembly protein CpaB
MNRRLMTLLLCAFVVAAGASFVVYRLVRNQVANGSTRRVTVLLAARDLEIGALIKATDIKTGEILGDPPNGAILTQDAAIRRGVISPIFQGEQLNEKRLALPGSGGGLAATIPPGMRACAVKVNEVVGVAGFVVPGMRVDVLISGTPPGMDPAGGSKVKTILQNIEVLSAGTNFQKDAEGKPANVPVVNLLVTPDQAELLSLAGSANQTHVQLVLRNPMDRQEATPPGVEMARLFGNPVAKPAVRPATSASRQAPPPTKPKVDAPPPPPPLVIQVINGAKTTEQKFPSQGVGREPQSK